MDPIRIFYSWQSDRDRGACERFIGLALEAAVKTLQPTIGVDLQIDSGTAGVAGTPPVSAETPALYEPAVVGGRAWR